MSEGIIQAGFHILFSNDISAEVQETYVNRHSQLGFIQDYNTHFHLGDIKEITGDMIWSIIDSLGCYSNCPDKKPSSIDVIFGGPPCQGFSRAGKRDSADPRNYLFQEYVRVINDVQPKYVVMENVEGFMDTKLSGFRSIDGLIYHGLSTAPTILSLELNKIGYKVLQPRILDASDYGVPQKRNRVIFIAYRIDCVAPEYPVPQKSRKLTISEAISDLIMDPSIRKEVFVNPSQYQLDSMNGRTRGVNKKTISCYEVKNHHSSNHNLAIAERFSLFKEGEKATVLRKRLQVEGIDLNKYPGLLAECSKKIESNHETILKMYNAPPLSDELIDILLTKKNMRIRLDRNQPSLTLMTIQDDYISPFENRSFTVREHARLQSFDDSFVFLGKRTTGGSRRKVEVPQYTQVGNAVPPLLAKAIANEIKYALKKNETKI